MREDFYNDESALKKHLEKKIDSRRREAIEKAICLFIEGVNIEQEIKNAHDEVGTEIDFLIKTRDDSQEKKVV